MLKRFSLLTLSLLAVSLIAACGGSGSHSGNQHGPDHPTKTCTPACASNETCDNGTCKPKDPNTCTPACASDETCDNGTCIPKDPNTCTPACASDETCDNGTCIPKDPNACTPACASDETCNKGVCEKQCNTTIQCGDSSKACINHICRPKTELCAHVTCPNSNYRCDSGQCIPTCSSDKLCGGVCCSNSETCFKNSCIITPPKSSNSSDILCDVNPSSPNWCQQGEGCFTKADGTGDHCATLGNECDNVTSFCKIGQYCSKAFPSPSGNGYCVKFSDTKLCRVGNIGTQQKEILHWYRSSLNDTDYNQVMAAPAVADIIPAKKGSEIIFTTFQSESTKAAYTYPGILRVISSEAPHTTSTEIPEATEIWNSRSIPNPFFTSPNTTPAIGDINGDGKPDIVIDAWATSGSNGRFDDNNHKLVAISGDGQTQYFRVDFGTYYPHTMGRWQSEADSFGVTGPMLIDLDQNGSPEILAHHLIYDNKGNLKCQLHVASDNSDAPLISAAIDFDGDGKKEIVTETGIFSYDKNKGCKLLATSESSVSPTLISIADLDGDKKPELIGINDSGDLTYEKVTKSGGKFTRKLIARFQIPLDKQRAEQDKGHPVGFCDDQSHQNWTTRECLPGGGKPTIADFDGDDKPEIGLAARYYYLIIKPNLKTKKSKILWAYKTSDFSSAGTSSSVFDFDGDGKAEVVYNDELHLYVFSGPGTGTDADHDGYNDAKVLVKIDNTTETRREYPVIVDVNHDGHANIVVAANNYAARTDYVNGGSRGIRVFADQDNKWVPTRKIWNQFAYYVTNISPKGIVPQFEQQNWTLPWLNNYLQNVQEGNPTLAPDLSAIIKSAFTGSCTPSSDNKELVFDINNLGDKAVGANTIQYKVEAIKGGKVKQLATGKTQTEIASKGHETVKVNWQIPSEWANQTFSLRVTVDSTNAITECDETNNVATLNDVKADAPNLVITAEPTSCQIANYQLKYKVTNDGHFDIKPNSVKVNIYAGADENNLTLIHTETIKTKIQPAQSADLTFTWNTPPSLVNRALVFKFVVDEDNQITECREDDNQYSIKNQICYQLG